MYLEKAKKILNEEYQKRRAENINGVRMDVIDEKIRHSYQVLGAGNYILRHEACFADCTADEKDFMQAVVLLHDVARFYEMLMLNQGIKIDHGVCGAQMLEKIPEFNRFDALLPIRHHGHLIEKLYEDEDFQKLSPEMQEKVKKIAFLVRDADKLANYYLLVSCFDEMEDMFLCAGEFENPYDKHINPVALKDFFAYRSVVRKFVCNLADKSLYYLSWVYDLNYSYSFEFLKKMKLVQRLVACFSKFLFKDDAEKCLVALVKFVQSKLP